MSKELVVHCFSDHDHNPEEANDYETQGPSFNCYYCNEIFPNKSNVMAHTKIAHTDKAKHCLNFLEGTCSYSDECWFLHGNTFKESNPKFNCKYCDKTFRTKTQLMHPKKQHHIEKVSMCTNEKTTCKYGSEKCWFIHTGDIEQAYESKTSMALAI